ncbi:MAG: Crp/Fnr family transcriptional regulator [Chloroflexi bacterium]|nr:Crp/Fnr family transcriptional regulator [Chloroflexota bacterium]
MPLTQYLRKVDVFQSLTMEEIEALFRGTMLRECARGTVIFTPEESSERLFVLKRGHVDIYRLTRRGKRLVIRRIGPSSIFGEMGILGQSMQGCFAESTDESLVCTATREDVLRVLKDRPDVATRLLETVGNRVKALEERLEQAVFGSVQARLAAFLLANLDSSTGAVSGYTHEEIGDTIGALRSTVTEELNDMQRQGLVLLGQKQIRVKDREALQALTQEIDAGTG